jgi:glycosyltransferase involved in cell wall biosynthesis
MPLPKQLQPLYKTTPTVSILTPTYNRSAFLPYLAHMILSQCYKLDDIEWVVVDDSETSQQEWFVENHPLQTRLARMCYVHLPQREPIGRKRNISKTLARGKYHINMDDDDYYAPNYVETVIALFQKPARPSIVGISTVCLMYPNTLFLQQTPPLRNPYHTCGGALSCTRTHALKNHYQNTLTFKEEPGFINRTPVWQIYKGHHVYMVFVHDHNTVPKNGVSRKQLALRWTEVVHHPRVLQFYLSLHADRIPWEKELPTPEDIDSSRVVEHGFQLLAQTVLCCVRKALEVQARIQSRVPNKHLMPPDDTDSTTNKP